MRKEETRVKSNLRKSGEGRGRYEKSTAESKYRNDSISIVCSVEEKVYAQTAVPKPGEAEERGAERRAEENQRGA